jgi:hypothetical protein
MRTLIAVPAMDMLSTDFCRSCVGLQLSGEVQWTFSQGSLVYDGRNILADTAVREGFDRVLWLDSDMVFDPYLFQRLSEHLDLGKEMVSGLYVSRKAPIHPVIYKSIRRDPLEKGFLPVAEAYSDYPRDSLFPVAGCGFGAVMMTTELLRRLQAAYGLPFTPLPGFGEDLSFCLRVQELGAEMWCDSSIKLGHAGMAIYTEAEYRPEP